MKAEEDVPRKAALIPLYGVVDKKPRRLDQDLVIIGRARGCDMVLDAPEVSNLHCVVYWQGDTLRLRDCSSRTGTRINGASRKHVPLHDGDILQVGPFSFNVSRPAEASGAPVLKSFQEQEHLERSRRNLARMALSLRKRLHALLVNEPDSMQLDMVRKAMGLRDRIRTFGQRSRDLEQAERELARDRAALDQAKEAHAAHVQQVEGELAGRLAAADAEIHGRWQEFQKRCEAEERRPQQARNQDNQPPADDAIALPPVLTPIPSSSLEEERRRLDADRQALTREIEEFSNMKDQWSREQAAAGQTTAEQTSLAEASLRQQRAQLQAMMQQLKSLQDSLRQQQKADVQGLVRENEQLKKLLHESNRKGPAKLDPAADHLVQRLREENEDLRRLLRELEQRLIHTAGANSGPEDLAQENERLRRVVGELEEQGAAGLLAAAVHEPEELKKARQELELVRQLMEEKDKLFEEMKQKLVEATRIKETRPESDLENYEAELNQYRQQLESDRTKLTKEIEQLRQRNQELDEATRELEMEMSRERAELARERQRLDRMREEVRAEVERANREGAARESLAPVNKLREEMMGKRTSAPPKNLADPVRSLRQRG